MAASFMNAMHNIDIAVLSVRLFVYDT